MRDKIKWGIIGTGDIARKFASELSSLKDAEIVAVGSRSKETAERFGKDFDIPRRYASYGALAEDMEIDVVYIANLHPWHKDSVLQCLRKNKAVLCEKPFAMNSAEAVEMVECARRQKVFLMEAMWTHCFPAIIEVRKLIMQQAIGDVRLMEACFCNRATWNPQGRLFNLNLGGGALLDVGVYNVALAHLVFDRRPSQIKSIAHIGKSEVDEQCSIILGYDNGAIATLMCALRTKAPYHEAAIYGTDGWIKIPSLFWQPDRIIVNYNNHKEQEIKFERVGSGYSYEALEVMRCLREKKLESQLIPLDRTIDVMHTLDNVRKEWGLKYPME